MISNSLSVQLVGILDFDSSTLQGFVGLLLIAQQHSSCAIIQIAVECRKNLIPQDALQA
jgi:hypothetical protein